MCAQVCHSPKITLLPPSPTPPPLQGTRSTGLAKLLRRVLAPWGCRLDLSSLRCETLGSLPPLTWVIHLDHTAVLLNKGNGTPLPPRKHKKTKEGKEGERKKPE